MIASHKETEHILQNMPEGIVIVDNNGDVKFMNQELISVLSLEGKRGMRQKIVTIYLEGDAIEDH